MRALGLIGILVAIGVLVFIIKDLWLPSAETSLNVKKQVEPKVQQIAGHTREGGDARDTIKLDADSSGGKMTGVIVTQIAEDGDMARYFGLKKNDEIVEIAPQGGVFMPVKDMGSPSEAKDHLLGAFSNSQQIVVLRNGKRVTLPAAPAAPAETAKKPQNDQGNPLSQQLDAISGPR